MPQTSPKPPRRITESGRAPFKVPDGAPMAHKTA